MKSTQALLLLFITCISLFNAKGMMFHNTVVYGQNAENIYYYLIQNRGVGLIAAYNKKNCIFRAAFGPDASYGPNEILFLQTQGQYDPSKIPAKMFWFLQELYEEQQRID